MAETRCAAVAVPVPVRRLFTYAVRPDLAERVREGSRVRVPFGGRRVVATVVECPVAPPDADVELRTIESVLDAGPTPTAEMLRLTRFVSDYYLCSWGEAIEAALPADPGPGRPVRSLRLAAAIDPAGAVPASAPARRRLLDDLAEAQERSIPMSSLTPARRRLVRPLVEQGLVEVVELAAERQDTRAGPTLPPEPARVPTPEQRVVLDDVGRAIDAGTYGAFLLFGATGSGKTEVYLQAARRAIERGRGVLYLVPEIGLTPLLVSTLRRRFPEGVAVLHSGLGRRERFATWSAVREGRLRFVLGTRSAVFAPLRDPGLIVVDEEQDGSYKQNETPRYNGRDLAVVRAREHGAVVLLGSATPSMESFRHARAGRYGLLRLGGRIEQRPLATVSIVDMREEYRALGEVTPLSATLTAELRACVERGEQALILRNRRGWAVALYCPTCGERVQCAACSVAMTWHRSARRLRCHYCGFEQRYPEHCPHCGADELHELGEGTERIEDLVRAALPGARIERMDRDTIRGRGAHERVLRSFAAGEIDVLVGTQMIAKGHDFPRVTLVGVLSADQSLGLPDFRAAERAFQLLTQVAGRAGRGERPGRVIAQAFDADHPVLHLAASQDYEAFFDREIRYRRALRYPPLSGLVQVLVLDRDRGKARRWGTEFVEALREAEPTRVLLAGPGPAPVERLKGLWREQILARGAGRRRLVQAVGRALETVEGRVPRRALVVDVDPQSLL